MLAACAAAILVAHATCYCPTCSFNATNATYYYESYAPFSVTDPLSCPPNSAVVVAGATSIDNCTCVTGYSKTDGICAMPKKAALMTAAIAGVALPGMAAAIGGSMFSFVWLQSVVPVPVHGIFVGVKITR